jgi:hypothetical protein
MVHPRFFEMVEFVCKRNGQLKIETNGHYLTPENCARLADLGVKAVQVSLDGATRATFNRMRVRGNFDTAVAGVRNLHAAAFYRDQLLADLFNVHRSAPRSTSPSTGAQSSTPGGRCTRATRSAWYVELTDLQYREFSRRCTRNRGVSRACACIFTRWVCSTSCDTAGTTRPPSLIVRRRLVN